jgi:hypothetical protein
MSKAVNVSVLSTMVLSGRDERPDALIARAVAIDELKAHLGAGRFHRLATGRVSAPSEHPSAKAPLIPLAASFPAFLSAAPVHSRAAFFMSGFRAVSAKPTPMVPSHCPSFPPITQGS